MAEAGDNVYVAVRVRPLNQRFVVPLRLPFACVLAVCAGNLVRLLVHLLCFIHGSLLTFPHTTPPLCLSSELDQGDGSNWVVNDESLTQCTPNGRPIPTASYSYGKICLLCFFFLRFFRLHFLYIDTIGSAPDLSWCSSAGRASHPHSLGTQTLNHECSLFNFFLFFFILSVDHVFGSGSKTEEVYQTVAKQIVLSTMDGINGTYKRKREEESGVSLFLFFLFFLSPHPSSVSFLYRCNARARIHLAFD